MVVGTKRSHLVVTRGAVGLCVALLFASAYAQTEKAVDVNALVQKVEDLAKTVETLKAANDDLKVQVTELEQRLGEKEAKSPEPAPPAVAVPPPAVPAKPENVVQAYWDKGLQLQTADGDFRLRLGGRVVFDVGGFHNPQYWELGGTALDETDGAELRALRIKLSGNIYEDYVYQLEVDFADNDVTFKDNYVGLDHVPVVGALRFGYFTEPFSLESMTTTNFITFMERSMVTEALAPSRSLGAAFSRSFLNDRLTWAAGVFRKGGDADGYWDATTRLTGLPWYAQEGRRLVHLGAAYSHQYAHDTINIETHPEAHMGNLHLSTGSFPVDGADRWGVEAALVYGPFSLQGEYMQARARLQAPEEPMAIINLEGYFSSLRAFDGYYVQASYFLTGENRAYDRETASFDRVIPRHNFSLRQKTWGAWELALRYSTLDLNDADMRSGVVGGEGENFTAGLNWYLSPNARTMLNYVRAHVEQAAYDGYIDIVQGRFQIDF